MLPAKGNLSEGTLETWLGLLTLVMVVRVVTCKATGAARREVSYFISSLKPDARKIGTAIGATGVLKMAYIGYSM